MSRIRFSALGFTGLVLSLGAMVSKPSLETIGVGLEKCRVRNVWAWCKEKLRQSVQSKRRVAYGPLAGATNSG
jgi:hypothetical protein